MTTNSDVLAYEMSLAEQVRADAMDKLLTAWTYGHAMPFTKPVGTGARHTVCRMTPDGCQYALADRYGHPDDPRQWARFADYAELMAQELSGNRYSYRDFVQDAHARAYQDFTKDPKVMASAESVQLTEYAAGRLSIRTDGVRDGQVPDAVIVTSCAMDPQDMAELHIVPFTDDMAVMAL